MAPALSLLTIRLIQVIFNPEDAAEASGWLEDERGNHLPFCDQLDEQGMERIRFAALKLSQGNIHQLLRAIDQARLDWRDLLVATDFGSDTHAHEDWAKELLKTK